MTIGGQGAWLTFRGFSADSSVKSVRLAKGTWRRVIAYAQPQRATMGIYLCVLMLQSALVIAQPLLFKGIVDTAIPARNTRQIVLFASLIALAAIADAALSLFGRWLSATIGERLILALRDDVFAAVQQQSIAFFTRAQTGALIQRINGDVIGAQRAFTSTLGGAVGNGIVLLTVLAAMSSLSWQITIAAILLLPVFLLPARLLGRQLQQQTREQVELNAAMSAQMAERFNVSGALLMKLFGSSETERKAFHSRADAVRAVGVRISTANSVFFTAMSLVAALATALVYGMGGLSVVNGALTLGTLLALIALIGRLYLPMTALSNIRIDVMTALVSFERVFEVLDLPPLVSDSPDARDLARGPQTIEFEHVSFRYPLANEVSLASLEAVARPEVMTVPEPVLTDISFSVLPGQLVALVGPSGSGKSTITALVARLYDATSGLIRISGTPIRDLTQKSLHAAIGVVTQDAHMFHDTIRANLSYAKPDATESEMLAVCDQARIGELVRDLGLDTVVGDRGYRLSGGEKQRLAIARLLLKAPDIVVLDEATAHLDSENEALVQAALSEALAGRTSLVVAHRLSTIRQADLILVLADGGIVERGTHEELVALGGLYSDLYRRQAEA